MLLPDGSWQVELTEADLTAAGASSGSTGAGTYTWTFDGARARLAVFFAGGDHAQCDAAAAPDARGVVLTYAATSDCGGEVDTISWLQDCAGLHLHLVATNACESNQAYLEAKPWQQVEAQALPSAPPWQSRCEPGCQGPVAAGTFDSVGFLAGLQLTFADDSWFNTADYQDEIEFDRGDIALRFWRNPAPSSESGEPLNSVPRTVEAITGWFASNPDMDVSKPQATALGAGGIAGTTFTMTISETNVNVDTGCPADVRSCLNVLWINDGHVFAIGYGEAVRFYLFGQGSDSFVVSLDAPSQAALSSMTANVAQLLESMRIP